MNAFSFYTLSFSSDIKQKIQILVQWHQSGQAGCLLIGYEVFRTLIDYSNSKRTIQNCSLEELEQIKANIKEYLLNPGIVFALIL